MSPITDEAVEAAVAAYAGACNHRYDRGAMRAALEAALEARLAEALKALDALDRMNRSLDWCDHDEQVDVGPPPAARWKEVSDG